MGDLSRQDSLQRRRADPDPSGNRFFWGISTFVLRQRECGEFIVSDSYCQVNHAVNGYD